MFSKRALLLIALPILMLANSACEKFLKGRSAEERLEAQVVNLKTDEVKCLKSTSKNLREFFADEGNEKTLPATIGCVQDSLKVFMRLTRGSQPGGYLSKEVQYFFNTFLMKENKISDDFLKEIMKVKVVVVGGSPDFITKLELEQFAQFLGDFQIEMQKLQGRMKLALFQESSSSESVSKESLDALTSQLTALSQFVLRQTKLTASRYQWTDFISLLRELQKFAGDSQDLEKVFKWVSLAESVKVLFLGENAKLISEADWEAASEWSVSAYATALKFFYQIKGNPFETPGQWKTLLNWMDEGIQVVESAPALRDRKVLEAQALDRIIDEIYRLELFKTVLTPEIAKSVYRKVLVHLVEAPAGRGNPLMAQGLTEAHLRVLKQEYTIWKISQKFLIETYGKYPVLKMINLRWYVNRYDIGPELVGTAHLEKDEIEKSWQDFKTLINNQPALTYDLKNKVRLAPRSEVEIYPFVGANVMNGLRSFTRLVLRGYGDRQSRSPFENRITRARMIHLEEDFRDFGRAIGLLDPRENNAASRTFDQGNFFTFSGNGDDVLSAAETFEVFNLMVSGARTQLMEVYDELKKHKCTTSEKDIFGKPFVSEACYKELFFKRANVSMDNMPGMASFLKSLNHQQREMIFKSLLSLSISKTHQKGWIESSEVRSINTIMHFIEVLMTVYDVNQDSQLSEEEVLLSLPRFGPFINGIIEKKPDWMDRNIGPLFLEDILLYLVYEGHEPSGADLLAFKTQRAFGLGEVGRANLIQMLSALNKMLVVTANNAPR